MDMDIKKKHFIDQKVRERWVLTLSPLLIGVLLKLYVDIPFRSEYNTKVTIAEYSYPIFFATSFFYVLFWYLRTGFKDRKILEQDPDRLKMRNENSELKSKLKQMQREIEFLHSHHFESQTNNSFVATQKNRSANPDAYTEEHILKSEINMTINKTRDLSFSRIEREISRSGFRGAIYLVSGVFLAVLGILALAGFVFPNAFGVYSRFFNSTPETGASDYATAIHYASKFSFIISIEILAYFFLRLHKSNLVEAKYYQNELTNLEIKYLSLDAALYVKRAETSHKVISNLSETERNHILEKGQSTTELKKIELEKNQFVEITKALASLTPKSK
ncbi:hypothetical protein [Pseudomonas sp. WS 5079]|uniref:hypothetical protein n=1 Tax=Pseudomonas sp. WS 5079 TaxID=2717492 RepID=UPI0015576C1D|nr:hypothetical protein [Pseudomonas sp. WS 5079]NMX62787.1 hypothetical protein [Pseudomonas sp. WS 5079]